MSVNDLQLPPYIIGTWAWGGGMNGSRMIFGRKNNKNELSTTFQRAIEGGLTFWDTAEVYGKGESEKILSECLRSAPGVRVSTKHSPAKKFVPGAMEKSLEASCRRLGIDAPDLYFLHSPLCIKENAKAALDLLRAGKIRAFGISNVSLEQVKQVSAILAEGGFRLGAVQNHFSLLSNPALQAPIIDWCKENHVPFFAYMVLEQGALTGRYDAEQPFPALCLRSYMFPKSKFRRIAPLLELLRMLSAKHGIEVSQIAIAWARAKGAVPLVGLTRPAHATDLIAGARVQLTDDEVNALDETAQNTGVVCKGVWEP